MKKILYLGLEDNYINGVKASMTKYSAKIELIVDHDHLNKKIADLFSRVLKEKPEILILDGEVFDAQAMNLFTALRTSNVTNIKHYICLSSEQFKLSLSPKEIAYGNYIHFYKSFEIKDIVYTLESLLLDNHTEPQDVVKAFYSAQMDFLTTARIYRFDRNSAFIQSNIKYKKPIEVFNFPFFNEIFQSHRHKITRSKLKRFDGKFKYSYDLEFLYYSKPIKHDKVKSHHLECEYELEERPVKAEFVEKLIALEEKQKNTLLIKKDEPQIDRVKLEENYVMAPNELVVKRKALFLNKMVEEGQNKLGSVMNLSIYDSTFELLNDEIFCFKDINYNVVLRGNSKNMRDELEADRPEVIGIFCNEINGVETAREILKNLVHIKNYFPYICFFNMPNAREIEAIRDSLQYHFIIANPGKVNSDFLHRVCEIYKKKFFESELNKAKKRIDRIFKENPLLVPICPELKGEHLVNHWCDYTRALEASTFFSVIKAELISINEFEIVFKSDDVFEIGQIFKITDPIAMHVVVVPHFKNSEESRIKNCYRGALHYLKESNKEAIRRYVNSIYSINNDVKSSLTDEEIFKLKRQYFKNSL